MGRTREREREGEGKTTTADPRAGLPEEPIAMHKSIHRLRKDTSGKCCLPYNKRNGRLSYAAAGKHIVDRVIGLSVGAQAWNSCEPVYRFCGLDSCPESMDDSICAVWGACLDFLCHARGLSVQ